MVILRVHRTRVAFRATDLRLMQIRDVAWSMAVPAKPLQGKVAYFGPPTAFGCEAARGAVF